MPTRIKKRRFLQFTFLGALGIIATLFALFHLSQAATQPVKVSASFSPMLVITAMGLTILTAVTIWQILFLLHRLKKHQSGAKLSISFALRMLFTTLIPVGIIGGFTWLFISYDLGKTFDKQVSIALEDALQLTRSSISMRARQAINQTQQVAEAMQRINYVTLVNDIEKMRRQINAIELSVFDHQGNLVVFAHQDLSMMSVESPSIRAITQIEQGQDFFEFASNIEDGYTVKVITDINKLNNDPFYLQAVYAMPEGFNTLAENVRDSYQQHKTFLFLRPHVTTSLLMVLSLILALTILSALWISGLFGEAMTRPVRQLIDATRKVTSGDFSTPITDMPNNDLGILGNNFNAMLLALHDTKSLNEKIQSELSRQNDFLITLLDNLTAGVLTLDWQGRLQLFNQAAVDILETELTNHTGHIPPMYDNHVKDSFGELMLALTPVLNARNTSPWRTEIILNRFGSRQTLICHGTTLPRQINQHRGGEVIVFEDVTEFQHNQRNAAWEEVARRLAHEIKNPLTPIRLQSERLQRKLTDKLHEAKDQHILERATSTIINQVDAMQHIVSDFSAFAKPIELRNKPIDINGLLKEIGELYPETPINYDLQTGISLISADEVQLRQVIHNLMKNAIEAMPEGFSGKLYWQTRQETQYIIVSLEDNGSGFADLDKDPFEPYVTSKSKGTGLGLAIVKKIINEHHGNIQAGHAKTLKGAKITFTLPIVETS